jgi:hypothetical protein
MRWEGMGGSHMHTKHLMRESDQSTAGTELAKGAKRLLNLLGRCVALNLLGRCVAGVVLQPEILRVRCDFKAG